MSQRKTGRGEPKPTGTSRTQSHAKKPGAPGARAGNNARGASGAKTTAARTASGARHPSGARATGGASNGRGVNGGRGVSNGRSASNGRGADHGKPANRKAKAATRQNGSSKGSKSSRIEIKGILLTATGILLMAAFVKPMSIGFVGDVVRFFLLGLFGAPAYFIPSVIVIAGVLTIFSRKSVRIFGSTFLLALALFSIISALAHTWYYNPANYRNLNYFKLVGQFYFEAARYTKGGGFVGGMLSMPFIYILRALGTQILFFALLLVDIVLLTNASVATFLRSVSKTAGKGAQKVR